MRRLLVLTVVALGVGCEHDPHAHLYTTEKPGRPEVVGTYTLVSETMLKSDLADLRGQTCSVQLKADGTFEASKIPPGDIDFPGPGFFGTFRSVSGTWRIDAVGAIDNGWRTL
jgi:hypothetical protein